MPEERRRPNLLDYASPEQRAHYESHLYHVMQRGMSWDYPCSTPLDENGCCPHHGFQRQPPKTEHDDAT